MSIGASSVPKDSGTPSPAASICSAKSLAPAGSSVPDAVPVIALLSMVARSMSTPPAAVSVPARSKLELPESSGLRSSGMKRSKLPSPFASMALPSLGELVAALDAGDHRPVDGERAAARPVGGRPAARHIDLDRRFAGQLQQVGDDAALRLGGADVYVRADLYLGAKSIAASMLPARPSLRAMLSCETILQRRGFRLRRALCRDRRHAAGERRSERDIRQIDLLQVDRDRQREGAGFLLRRARRLRRSAPPRSARRRCGRPGMSW